MEYFMWCFYYLQIMEIGKVIYTIGAVILIIGAILKIFHVSEYGQTMFLSGLILIGIYRLMQYFNHKNPK